MLPRKSKGHQKIQMARVEKASDFLVTFSKRRCGLFTTGSKLIILCRVEIATILFSGCIKVFSFSHSSLENYSTLFSSNNVTPRNIRVGVTGLVPSLHSGSK
ncbi:putative transcription factor MADS-type1 family [Helianthus anomalus]